MGCDDGAFVSYGFQLGKAQPFVQGSRDKEGGVPVQGDELVVRYVADEVDCSGGSVLLLQDLVDMAAHITPTRIAYEHQLVFAGFLVFEETEQEGQVLSGFDGAD